MDKISKQLETAKKESKSVTTVPTHCNNSQQSAFYQGFRQFWQCVAAIETLLPSFLTVSKRLDILSIYCFFLFFSTTFALHLGHLVAPPPRDSLGVC